MGPYNVLVTAHAGIISSVVHSYGVRGLYHIERLSEHRLYPG